jgi:hypothetical protein
MLTPFLFLVQLGGVQFGDGCNASFNLY